MDSLGIQSLNDKSLKFMKRDHDAKTAFQAIETIQSVFDHVSLDFIWGLPGQTVSDWIKDLSRIHSLGMC